MLKVFSCFRAFFVFCFHVQSLLRMEKSDPKPPIEPSKNPVSPKDAANEEHHGSQIDVLLSAETSPAASFFRSLGAVLGFRPPVGSLWGKTNQCNYRFSPSDTATVIEWINEHLSVQWLCRSTTLANMEREAIHRYRPLLNIAHNPAPSPELEKLRAVCVALARQAP